MNHVGIDLHKRIIVFCVMNDKREIVSRRKFSNHEEEKIVDFLKTLGKFQAVFEATAAYEWFYLLIEPLAEKVILAHPKKLRIIAESTQKSDKIDAKVLALFLALDMIPEAHRPSPYIQGYRRLVRLRYKIQSRITSVKNRIRHVLASYNLDRKDLFTREGQEWLRTVKVRKADRFTLDTYIQEGEFVKAQLKQTMEQIREYTKKAPQRIQEGIEIVKTAPGIGIVSADIIMSELGEVDRFTSQKKVSAYAGLDPGFRQSGEKEKELSISKEGSNLLRWCMIEAAWSAVQHSRKWKGIFDRLYKQTRNTKKAIVGVARRLLCVIVSMLKNGCAYKACA